MKVWRADKKQYNRKTDYNAEPDLHENKVLLSQEKDTCWSVSNCTD